MRLPLFQDWCVDPHLSRKEGIGFLLVYFPCSQRKISWKRGKGRFFPHLKLWLLSLCKVLFCSGRIRQIFGWCPDTGSGSVSTSFFWGNSIASATKGRAAFSATLVPRDEPWVQSVRHLVLAWLCSSHPTTHPGWLGVPVAQQHWVLGRNN